MPDPMMTICLADMLSDVVRRRVGEDGGVNAVVEERRHTELSRNWRCLVLEEEKANMV